MALVVVATWKVWPRERLLTEVARAIGQVKPQESWSWLTSDKLLVITTEQEGHWTGSPSWKGQVDQFNCGTHQRIPLPGLTRLFNHPDISPLGLPNSMELSPGHTWLIWNNHRTGDMYPFPAAAHLDGTHYREWGSDKDESGFFLDDQHYVQETGDRAFSVVVRDLQNPKNDREDSTPEQAKAILARYAVKHPVFITMPEPDSDVRGTPSSTDIEVYRIQDRLQSVHAEGNEGQGAPTPIHTWKLKFPIVATLQHGEVSPQQQAIFFDRVTSQLSPLLVWLHRMIPKFNPKPTITEALWVSRSDGRGLREIGYVPAHLNEDGRPTDGLQNVRWLPDGKHISFIYHSTLYVVPAESKG